MTFQWPVLLWSLALVPVLAGLYLLAQHRRRRYAVRFTNLALLREVVGQGPGLRRHIPPLLYLLAAATLLVALARPTAVIRVPRDQVAVMMVLDVSGSMAANDLQPNRLEAAKQAASALATALPDNVQLGLVSFSSGASLNTPLTTDREAVLRAVQRLTANGGTAIGDGLWLALDQLAEPPGTGDQRPPAVVVLLSDGQRTVGRPVEEAAARAASEQVKVYTVGIGERGAAPRVAGGRVAARLDEQTLQQIASETDGRYFYAQETQQLEQIYADLGSQVSWVEERTEVTALASALGALLLVAGGLLSVRWLQQLP